MIKGALLASAVAMLLVGCATVPMESKEASERVKAFPPPSEGHAGVYVFRAGVLGAALKKDLWVDGQCLGESAPDVFFFTEVAGNQEHVIATESEFSPNEIKLAAAPNQNYFVEQYIKWGVFVGGANLRVVDESVGKQRIQQLNLAAKGTCSGAR